MNARLRYEILRRDGYRCRYCGNTADDGAKLHVDHVIPASLGGTDDPGNLVAACADCNRGKASTSADDPMVADVQEDALRWAEAIKAAANEQTMTREFERSRSRSSTPHGQRGGPTKLTGVAGS